jgi:hypothetical protein
MKKHAHLFFPAVQSLSLLGLTATLCFGQASPFGQVAQGWGNVFGSPRVPLH